MDFDRSRPLAHAKGKTAKAVIPSRVAVILLAICVSGGAVAQHFSRPEGFLPSASLKAIHVAPSSAAPNAMVHRAQAKVVPPAKLIVDVSIQGKSGTKIKLPARLEPPNPESTQFVMLYQVPAWIKIIGGETVGSGVWLVPAKSLAATELQFEASAAGRQEIVVSLLATNGKDVQSESKMVVEVAAATAGASPKTWQSLVGGAPGAPQAAQPAPAKATAATTNSAKPDATNEQELVQYARHLVRECTTCHSLFGTDQGIPVMVGLTKDRFIDTMDLYRNGRRDHGPMKSIAESLDERDTLALALYLSRIRPAAQTSGAVASATATSSAGSADTSTPITLTKRTSVEKPERIDRWLKRGQELLKSGEIVQARLMFERAAEHGNPLGAYWLGTSYDPNVLPWRPGMGIEAEPSRARDWYIYAKQLGPVAEADLRLSDLR